MAVPTKRTSGYFSYDKARRIMTSSLNRLGLQSFPPVLDIVSTHTGRIARFVQDTDAAVRNEFWDGEQMVYVTKETDMNRLEVVVLAWSQENA